MLCLDWKKEGNFRNIHLYIISILGAVILLIYIKNPENFFWFILLAAIVILLMYLVYAPKLSREKRAKKMAGEKGEYRLEVTDTFLQYGRENEKLSTEEKKIRLYISEHMYTLNIEGVVFSIPKRILTEEQQKELRQKARAWNARIMYIVIEKERRNGKTRKNC